VLRLALSELERISRAAGRSLRAVYAPLAPPRCDLPGADGHAGIEGLAREPRCPKPVWRALLDDIAAACAIVQAAC